MNERRGQDDEQPDIARRVRELEGYCYGRELSLEGVQERIRGIPSDAVRDSNIFHIICQCETVTLEIIQCFLHASPDAARTSDEWEYTPLHHACINGGATLEVIECLLGEFPDAARSNDNYERLPLHRACENENADPRIVRVLLDRWPESANRRDDEGNLPLHNLCKFPSDSETVSLAILGLLLAAAPNSATLHRAGCLPIYLAIESGKAFPFCKMLIDSYPESLRVRGGAGGLPIHDACREGNVETVKYMLEQYPETIDARDTDGDLPIHSAARSDGQHKVDIIRYLLSKDPGCVSKMGARSRLPLHRACRATTHVTPVCLDSVRLLFDAYPEAIDIRDGGGKTPVDVARELYNARAPELRAFLENQLRYVRLSEDITAMATVDPNWGLPLHRALWTNASLGAIKLLIEGNRDALAVSDTPRAAFPLHIACEYSTVEIVQHLLGLSDIQLHELDSRGDSPLHYACHGGNLGVVKYLLERGVPSVTEPNDRDKLPIHCLWESESIDPDSVEYVDVVWRLLLAHPETVTF